MDLRLVKPGSLEIGALFSPSSVKPVDELLRVVFRYFCVYSGAGAVFRMTTTFEAAELFDNTVCKNLPRFSNRFTVND